MNLTFEEKMDFINTILKYIVSGGSDAIVSILFFLIIFLIWDRKRLIESLDKTTQKIFETKENEIKSIKEIIDRYHQGNLDLTHALNEIKMVLVSIQTNINKNN